MHLAGPKVMQIRFSVLIQVLYSVPNMFINTRSIHTNTSTYFQIILEL